MAEALGLDPHAALLELMMKEEQNEIACRKYLPLAKELLIKETVLEYLKEDDEYRGHSGDSDYIIVCKACDEVGIQSNQAYIWEVKAPQCYIFEEDTMNRVKPSKDLISAENQLLHYYEESKGSDQFRDEFEITHPENVKLGGIIIGSKKTRVKSSNYSEDVALRLFTRALNLRRRYLYGNSGIKVLIWDTILDHLQVRSPVSEIIVKPADSEIKVADKILDIVSVWNVGA